MREAIIIGIAAIQVMCPECKGLCRTITELENKNDSIRSSDEMPFITLDNEMYPVQCLRCHDIFALPKRAFVSVDLSTE